VLSLSPYRRPPILSFEKPLLFPVTPDGKLTRFFSPFVEDPLLTSSPRLSSTFLFIMVPFRFAPTFFRLHLIVPIVLPWGCFMGKQPHDTRVPQVLFFFFNPRRPNHGTRLRPSRHLARAVVRIRLGSLCCRIVFGLSPSSRYLMSIGSLGALCFPPTLDLPLIFLLHLMPLTPTFPHGRG